MSHATFVVWDIFLCLLFRLFGFVVAYSIYLFIGARARYCHAFYLIVIFVSILSDIYIGLLLFLL